LNAQVLRYHRLKRALVAEPAFQPLGLRKYNRRSGKARRVWSVGRIRTVSERMNDPLAPLTEIMRRHGARCSAAEFHAAVNVTFHGFESEIYDELHRDMWESLPREIALLAADCLGSGAPERIQMLDIGCGTGLATDLLLRSPLGPQIAEVDLLDTSAAMLARAEQRRKQWGKPGETMEGLVEGLAGRKRYNLVVTCSVLHHVPDLESFLGAVKALQSGGPDGSLFVHLQDPNGDFLDDPERKERAGQIFASKLPEWAARLAPRRVWGRLKREIKGEQGQDYISKTNRELVKAGVISTPLSTAEIFTITDIHVHDGGGVSIERMKTWLSEYQLVSRHSYAFFGVLASNLPLHLRAAEEQLARNGALNGEYIAAAWRLGP
jgi:2-polyprenyl-3-methyl-5-hydroxy-6-metoxy-1,4-benzoquinol methylase